MANPFFMPYSVWVKSNPTIPKLYWGIYSQEERIMRICREIAHLVGYMDMLGASFEEMKKELDNLIENFAENFDTYYKEQIEEWLNDNLEDLIAEHMRFVWFGLTDDGYFCAYVPSNWDMLQFSTGYDYDDASTYGHLILTY